MPPSRLRRALRFWWIYLLPLIAPWAILFAVNATSPSAPPFRTSIPHESWLPDHCTGAWREARLGE